jgi:hypothetical protein
LVVTHLLNTVRILANRLANLLVHFLFILLGGKLDQEVTSIYLEHGRQKLVIIDIVRMDRITIATRTGMNADINTFFGGKTPENPSNRELDQTGLDIVGPIC